MAKQIRGLFVRCVDIGSNQREYGVVWAAEESGMIAEVTDRKAKALIKKGVAEYVRPASE